MAGIRLESAAVAPTGSRLYRRLVIGERLWSTKQAASPRYSRLPVGATFLSLAIMRIAVLPVSDEQSDSWLISISSSSEKIFSDVALFCARLRM